MTRQERFELHSWGIVLRPWPDVPAIHVLGVKRPWHAGNTTRCGRELGLYLPLLPMKHALKFGRPCRDCLASLPQEGA